MGWLIAAGVIVLLAVLPLGVSVIYNDSGLMAWLLAGPVRVKVYPSGKKKAKRQENKQASEKPQKTAQSRPKEKKGGSYQDFLPILQILWEFLGVFRRKLRVNRLEMKLIMASDDPCDLAVNYGRAWAAVGNLMPQLERLFVIKKKDIEVECDFTDNQTRIFARLDLTITVGRLLSSSVVYGVRIFRQYLKIMKTRKGGAQ